MDKPNSIYATINATHTGQLFPKSGIDRASLYNRLSGGCGAEKEEDRYRRDPVPNGC